MGALMKRAYNESKHAGKKHHVLRMNPKSEAREYIDRAISNLDSLIGQCGYDLPDLPLAQQFRETMRARRGSCSAISGC